MPTFRRNEVIFLSLQKLCCHLCPEISTVAVGSTIPCSLSWFFPIRFRHCPQNQERETIQSPAQAAVIQTVGSLGSYPPSAWASEPISHYRLSATRWQLPGCLLPGGERMFLSLFPFTVGIQCCIGIKPQSVRYRVLLTLSPCPKGNSFNLRDPSPQNHE